jgi:hypothetical protein
MPTSESQILGLWFFYMYSDFRKWFLLGHSHFVSWPVSETSLGRIRLKSRVYADLWISDSGPLVGQEIGIPTKPVVVERYECFYMYSDCRKWFLPWTLTLCFLARIWDNPRPYPINNTGNKSRVYADLWISDSGPLVGQEIGIPTKPVVASKTIHCIERRPKRSQIRHNSVIKLTKQGISPRKNRPLNLRFWASGWSRNRDTY